MLVLVAVAAVDAVRNRGGDGEADGGSEAAAAFPAEELRRRGVTGVLVYTDPDCRLRAVRLPEGGDAPPPERLGAGCAFSLSPEGRRAAPEGARWATEGTYALCTGARVDVYVLPSRTPQRSYTGCVPAWRGTGAGRVLTVVRDGAVVEACESFLPCRRVVLDREDVRAAARASLDDAAEARADVVGLDWAGPDLLRALVVLRLPFGAVRRVVATYEDGRLIGVEPLGPGGFPRSRAVVDRGRVVVDGVRLPIEARDAALVAREGSGELAALGATGTLVYTDAGCRFHAVRLPGLEPGEAPRADGLCRFSLSPGGAAEAEGAVWTGGGRRSAYCGSGGATGVHDRVGNPIYVVDGCAPAWRTGNALTVARGASIVQVLVDCRRGPSACERVVLPSAALDAAARTHPNAPDGGGFVPEVRVKASAWLDQRRLALLLSTAFRSPDGRLLGPWDTVALHDGARLAAAHHAFDDHLTGLELAPGGHLVARPDTLLRSDGSEVPLPAGGGPVRALAVSPDGRLAALAARGAILVVELDGGRSATVPVAAADLAWR